MSEENNELYEFGPFRLDVGEHTLTGLDGSKSAQLPEKAFQTLCIFVQNSGRLLTKKDMIAQIWPDSFVEENNLDKCIHAIRHALGEKPNEQRYIQTVRKHGYRFVAEVRKLPADDNGIDAATALRSDSVGASPVTRKNALRVAFLVLAVGIVLAGLYVVGMRKASESTSIPALRGTANENAYRYYLNAVNLMGRVSLPVAQEAVESLEEAIRLDPGFARAYAGLARGRVELSNLVDDPKPDCDKARVAVGQALVLDAALAEAFQASGLLKHRCEWDFAGAESDLNRALVLDPHSDSTHAAYASYLNAVGRSEEAVTEIEQAISLNPNSIAYHIEHGKILYCARRYDDSIAALRHADETGQLGAAHGWLYTAYIQKGDDAQAFEWFLKSVIEKQIKPDPTKIQQLRSIFEIAGWKGIREMQLETEMASPVYVKGRFYRISRLAVQLGKTDDAFRYLNMAIERHDAQLLLLKSEPTFDPVRSDPRYPEILQRIGFPPNR